MTNKEIILDYCKSYECGCIDTLQVRDDIVTGLTNPKFEHYLLSGCPSSWGLDDFEGNCYNKDSRMVDRATTNEEKLKQCKDCWKRALSE